MLPDISRRLTEVVEQRRLKQKIENDLRQIDHDLWVQAGQLDELEAALKKEQLDVEKLERLSLAGLFYTVLGSKEQQAEKERQEALAAQLKLRQAKRTVEMLRVDQMHLERQLEGLDGVESEYETLLAQKETLLRQDNPALTQQLLDLSEQVANARAEQREIDEAVAAARAVLASLEQVIDSLESAEGWGTWDLLGGGFLATAVKHSRIDDARAYAEDAQAKMARFTRELADVQRTTDLTIDIGGLSAFADFFFDGLIADWVVQSKIQSSLEQARQAQARITATVDELARLRDAAVREEERLTEQRAALIAQA